MEQSKCRHNTEKTRRDSAVGDGNAMSAHNCTGKGQKVPDRVLGQPSSRDAVERLGSNLKRARELVQSDGLADGTGAVFLLWFWAHQGE